MNNPEVNTKDITSFLSMLDLFFSEISFSYKKEKIGELKINVNYKFEHLQNDKDKTIKKTIITTLINDCEGQFYLKVVCNGIFKIDENTDLSDNDINKIFTMNTIAIMFPYIRSQISIITTQPGLTAIQLPIVDVNKIVKDTITK